MIPFDPKQRLKLIQQYDLKFGMHPTTQQGQDAYRELNKINLDGSERIYRIYSWDRFKDLLHTKTDSLVPTYKWDDPFENFILGSKAVHDGNDVDLQQVRNSWYGQCWSLTEESDGLWRTYTEYTHQQHKIAVKVSTTVDKLFNNLYDFSNKFHALSFFIGKVEYVDKNDILQILSQDLGPAVLNSDNIFMALSLFIKRKEFRYEDEVRILYNHYDSRSLPNVYSYNLDPNTIFDEIVVDPWTDLKSYTQIENEIKASGYARPVSLSDLYAPNNSIITI